MTLVTVTKVIEAPGSSVWEAEGVDEFGISIRFAGDWRPMQDIAHALKYSDDEVVANVEDWAIISRGETNA